MTNSVAQSELAASSTRLDPQRMAWGILLIAFAVFCVICVVTGLGVHWFLFQSVVPLTAHLDVGRGTAGIIFSSDPIEQVARVEYDISGARGTTVGTDSQSQVTILFRDVDHLIASVTLRSNTSLNVRDAVRPRFDWSTGRYDIVLDNFSGEADIFIAPNFPRAISIGVQTLGGFWLLMDGSGHYIASATVSQVRVINLDGHADLVGADPQNNRNIPIGGQAVVNMADNAQIGLSGAAYTNFLINTVLPNTPEAAEGGREPGEDIWTCSNGENDTPRGDYSTEIRDGRTSLRLLRSDDADSHGETRCIKWFGQAGQNIESYDYLALRAEFLINYQSVNTCGIEGSECPLTLRLDYIDTAGVPRRWFYGFYYFVDAQQSYPVRCNDVTCTQDHQRVNEKSWYSFDSGNLFSLFTQNQLPLPSAIINVQFYASGHQYDVYVSEVALVVGQNTLNAVPSEPLAG